MHVGKTCTGSLISRISDRVGRRDPLERSLERSSTAGSASNEIHVVRDKSIYTRTHGKGWKRDVCNQGRRLEEISLVRDRPRDSNPRISDSRIPAANPHLHAMSSRFFFFFFLEGEKAEGRRDVDVDVQAWHEDWSRRTRGDISCNGWRSTFRHRGKVRFYGDREEKNWSGKSVGGLGLDRKIER